MSLRVSKNIPTTKDVEPLLEIDGDVRSFEVFLSSRTPVLTARDIRTFLPCTVNLDPKLREIIAGTNTLLLLMVTSPSSCPCLGPGEPGAAVVECLSSGEKVPGSMSDTAN